VSLSIYTEEPLLSVSVAVNFDEGALNLVDARRLFEAEAPGAFADVRSTTLNNRDLEPGDQAREGWGNIEIESADGSSPLPIPLGVVHPLTELEFFILPDAPLGFSVVRFESLGPVRLANQTVLLINAVEVAGRAAPDQAVPLAAEAFEDGGIKIIGEVGFFMRGDADLSCRRDISDPILTLRYLFLGAAEPHCLDAADSDDSGVLDVSDPVFTLQWLYRSGSDYRQPFQKLGTDPTPDILDCALGFEDDEGCGTHAGGA
jgi:hypothetical protein